MRFFHWHARPRSLCVAPARSAHDEFRIIGTLTRVQSHQIDVKQKDNRTVVIKVDGETIVTRDKKTVPGPSSRPA